jgi:hypothetical protein
MAAMNKANRGMEAMFGDRREAKGIAEPTYADLPPKRAYTKRQDTQDSERSVLKRIRAALRKHPNVAFCWREQSGLFGTVNVGFTGKPDLIGMLRNGRFFAIECKRADGGVQSPEQAYYLSLVRAGGGLADRRADYRNGHPRRYGDQQYLGGRTDDHDVEERHVG